MKVILTADVKSLGKKGEIVDVSDGYARNMLLPKKLGVEANSKNINDLKLQKANEDKVAKEILEQAKALAAEIAEAAKAQIDLELDKKKIQLSSPIRTLGVTMVPVKLHPKVTAELKVHVKEA